ncbi:biotin--[acetyl-CoA-carboxylase] ligase [Halosegnis marinus]|uniref:Biotin--[acetyl-CoA-carboxylase] ligase n=1 Tax=Halosegnis marinus TaxID=3034023 RepID=A0ABD5ZKR0_9EURY|nr:biotin--[acetyl-CoA-carboxylase] ligase [Halosegnis sp. DT85]
MQETRRRVLAALADGPVAGPALADDLGVSRAAVWNHVEALRAEGFGVEDTGDGYELVAVPEYGGAAVAHALGADYDVAFHDELPSTNARARDLAAEGATDTLVVAARQTGGRGRLDREWASPEGGIYASLLVRPDVPATHAPAYTLAAAVAVADAARSAGVDAGIKWPNDVLVPTDDGARKLCGVLTEMEGEADRVSWLVVGIGVNANVAREDLPETATSVLAETGPVERRALLAEVVDRFADLTADLDAVLPAWRDRALTLGREVRVETPGGTVEGTATDVEFPGTLVVETADGPVRVTAGDCEHLRPR